MVWKENKEKGRCEAVCSARRNRLTWNIDCHERTRTSFAIGKTSVQSPQSASSASARAHTAARVLTSVDSGTTATVHGVPFVPLKIRVTDIDALLALASQHFSCLRVAERL